MTPVSDRLSRRLDELVFLSKRQVLGIAIDPIHAARMDQEARMNSADGKGHDRLEQGVAEGGMFRGYPVKSSPRPGVWIIMAEREGEPFEVEL